MAFADGPAFLLVQAEAEIGAHDQARFFDGTTNTLTKPTYFAKLMKWCPTATDRPVPVDSLPKEAVDLLRADGWL